MVEAVLNYIRQYHMVEPGDVVIAGISGGADSVCLLLVLEKLSAQLSISVEAVHVNHGIRDEAGEDAEFVRKLCEEHGISFHLICADVEALARREKLSTEEMGRKVRYEAFTKILGERKGKIAVAHNSNDRAETMLFHLFRGTGLAGACGIRPVQGKVIRPLLFLQRKEIEQWLYKEQEAFCTDATNLEDDYTRNRIRHHILSYAEEEIVNGAVANMNRAANQLQEADEYIERQTSAAQMRCCIQNDSADSVTISIPLLKKEDTFVQKRLLFQMICQAAGQKKDITEAHILNVLRLLDTEGSKECSLPYHVHVYKQYDLVKIEKKHQEEKGCCREEYPTYRIEVPSMIEIPALGNVEFQTFPYEKSQIIPQKTYTKWFDYDKITKTLFLRPKQAGDYLTVNRQMGRKSLQDYFVDQKIPKENRNSLYVLAMEHHVLWVPGLRISEFFKVTDQTKHVLQVRVLTMDVMNQENKKQL